LNDEEILPVKEAQKRMVKRSAHFNSKTFVKKGFGRVQFQQPSPMEAG